MGISVEFWNTYVLQVFTDINVQFVISLDFICREYAMFGFKVLVNLYLFYIAGLVRLVECWYVFTVEFVLNTPPMVKSKSRKVVFAIFRNYPTVILRLTP